MTKILTSLDKFELIALIIKGVTGVIGGSLVLTQEHPYLTLIVLAIGGAANEYISFMQRKINRNFKEKSDKSEVQL